MIYLVDLESVESRYTKQWKTHFPKVLGSNGLNVTVIDGPRAGIPEATTPGAFLNFGGTNIYKAAQITKISQMFCEGKIKDGDYFLYADAWNPTVIQLKYMAELLGVKIRIGGMWHAGSYDPQDFLGRLIGNQPWVRNAEMSMYECFDDNYFATKFHIDMFTQTFFEDDRDIDRQLLHSIRQVGWPMEYIESDLANYKGMAKEDMILFPHRLAPEKQPEVFDYLSEQMPEYNWVKCQELNLSKEEYHTMLGKAKMVFSANLQETLGISVFEGLVVGAIPLVPDRLSYTEMWSDTFKYPSEWTTSLDAVKENIEQIKTHIRILMNKNSDMSESMNKEIENVRNFYSVNDLVTELHKYNEIND
tara:strand:+ start:24160 stop:25242 length:1083 start_codon:yes stop_codon:yes gene_type:complete